MPQHQLQKNWFREPLARLPNASLIRQSFAVTCTHQRTEATALDKVIYELFGFVSHFYKYMAPQSMSECVSVSGEWSVKSVLFHLRITEVMQSCERYLPHQTDLLLDKIIILLCWGSFKLG